MSRPWLAKARRGRIVLILAGLVGAGPSTRLLAAYAMAVREQRTAVATVLAVGGEIEFDDGCWETHTPTIRAAGAGFRASRCCVTFFSTQS